ncbi:MAG: type VII toxin-antitoxin system HepT family RNase toxin [Planctomycetota bacterium]|jgi:uncharacterized protein YutE (UPF0331/DUF86 family)
MPIQPDEVLLNKSAVIERCIKRIKHEYSLCPRLDNFTNVDAMTLNIERACQAAIDMANHLTASEHLGIPQSSANAFELLESAGKISSTTLKSMKAISGFRNIAIHEYREIDVNILRYIAEKGYKDFIKFCADLELNIIE